MRTPYRARRSRRCEACPERIRVGQSAARVAQHRYVHWRHVEDATGALPALTELVSRLPALFGRLAVLIRDGVGAYLRYAEAAERFSATVALAQVGVLPAWTQTGPVFLLCRGCRRAWWDDEEPACTCEPGDPDYEAWVEVGP